MRSARRGAIRVALFRFGAPASAAKTGQRENAWASWDWQVFLQDTGGGQTYLHWMMSAWGWTLSVAVLALIVALVVGSLMGILRTTPSKPLVLHRQRLDRAVPQHPAAGPDLPLVPRHPVDLPVAARGAELRAGRLRARLLHLGADRRAGAAPASSRCPRASATPAWRSGLTLPQTYRYVLLPMAFRIIIPPLTSESMNIIKNTSVAFAVSASPS